MTTSPIASEILARFLAEKKRSSYANKDAKKAPSSRLKSQDYHFERDNLIYHDTFFGDRDFIGEEVVYRTDRPVWAANYFGFLLDDGLDEKRVYNFLQTALMEDADPGLPVRGPQEFISGDWSYHFSSNGSLANFTGQEEIRLNGAPVYRLLLHGGFIR